MRRRLSTSNLSDIGRQSASGMAAQLSRHLEAEHQTLRRVRWTTVCRTKQDVLHRGEMRTRNACFGSRAACTGNIVRVFDISYAAVLLRSLEISTRMPRVTRTFMVSSKIGPVRTVRSGRLRETTLYSVSIDKSRPER